MKCTFPGPVHRACRLETCTSPAPRANLTQVGRERAGITPTWQLRLRAKAWESHRPEWKDQLRGAEDRGEFLREPISLSMALNIRSHRVVGRLTENSMCTGLVTQYARPRVKEKYGAPCSKIMKNFKMVIAEH